MSTPGPNDMSKQHLTWILGFQRNAQPTCWHILQCMVTTKPSVLGNKPNYCTNENVD